ncbi:TPA: hypothetical protein ACSEXO_003475 [Proteus mirabilis]|uniref:hypothetical protein n=1 Tax=Proteus TaxID=583 RepID=UPI001378E80F|nr:MULTISPECIES: hypothetical protein [Proteus]ELT1805275.1 hypothetical protein [Proteus mirabilis]ELZ9636751.1 hypothetical protein [Proteus mirabilis]MBS3880747.1 hypothetical protein [Proteus mirabilis]MBT0657722.1 hypothetical protein [Proteus mirabilis]MCT0093411.1 hypothetical protein [Proteus mirabilis]
MKKNFLDCPVCGNRFNPKSPLEHIQKYHQHATDRELIKIRDARRACFGKPYSGKKISSSVLPSMSLYATTHKKNGRVKDVTARC